MIIYKITNVINGKIYVGQKTNINTECDLLESNYYGSSKYLKKSIEEFGKENFTREVVDYSDDIKELCEKEEYWIEKLNSTDTNVGYNKTKKVGKFFHTGCKHSIETKTKMSEAKIGNVPWNKGLQGFRKGVKRATYTYTIESKIKMRECKIGNTPWNKNRPWSEEEKEKLRNGHINENRSKRTKYIIEAPNKEIIEILGYSEIIKFFGGHSIVVNGKSKGYKIIEKIKNI